MSVQRGEVILVDFPFISGSGSKVRPALVVQNDLDNRRLTSTIIAQITGTTRRSIEPTQLLVELSDPDALATGLRQDSVVNCVNVLTINQGKVLRKIGVFFGIADGPVGALFTRGIRFVTRRNWYSSITRTRR